MVGLTDDVWNPGYGAEIPLMRQYWLAKKDKKEVTLFPYIKDGAVEFRILGDGYEEIPTDFDPKNGSVARAVVTCPVCGSVVDAKTTRRMFQEGKAGQRMVAVVLHHPKKRGKTYRVATVEDVRVFSEAAGYLEEKREWLMLAWGMDPVPDEALPPTGTLGFRIQRYNMSTWGDLFNPRQKLALIAFVEKVRQAHARMLEGGAEAEYAKAVVSYLAISFDKLPVFNSSASKWQSNIEKISNAFANQSIPMSWEYPETNPVVFTAGSYETSLNTIIGSLKNLLFNSSTPLIAQSSATALPHPDNFFDAVFTDPPYYDNVPYSYLSDFFYVWLKRTLGHIHPDLFSTPLTPKKNEIVAYSHGEGGFAAGKQFFESMLKQSFQEIHRVLKPDGITTIVYAHKSTEGWETLINSLLDSGLIVTGAWPLHTEMKTRLRAKESAALASSIYIVARKMEREPTGFYNEVSEDLKRHLNEKLHRLWDEGLGGADFFIAAIGSAIEVFGRYEKVMDYEGEIVRADRLLSDVRRIATDYAVQQILHNGFSGEITDLTRFYVLYRWSYGAAKVQFDDAHKLAMSCNIDVAEEWGRIRGFIKKEKGFVRVLGPQERKPDDLKNPSELIDVLHRVLLLWENSKRDEMVSLLRDSGYGGGEAFYRVAQAVSETLPIENKEKKLLDGFLAKRERLREEVRKEDVQTRLFE